MFILLVMSITYLCVRLLILMNIPCRWAGGVMIQYVTGRHTSVPSLVGFIALQVSRFRRYRAGYAHNKNRPTGLGNHGSSYAGGK
jgi:hypothetical protein